MKTYELLFTKILRLVLLISTIIVGFIVYKDIGNKVAIGFVIGYVIFILLFLFYLIIIAIFKLRKLKGRVIRKRLIKFSIYFITVLALSYILNYFFRPEKAEILRSIGTAFGVAFGIAFGDIVFSKMEEN